MLRHGREVEVGFYDVLVKANRPPIDFHANRGRRVEECLNLGEVGIKSSNRRLMVPTTSGG